MDGENKRPYIKGGILKRRSDWADVAFYIITVHVYLYNYIYNTNM